MSEGINQENKRLSELKQNLESIKDAPTASETAGGVSTQAVADTGENQTAKAYDSNNQRSEEGAVPRKSKTKILLLVLAVFVILILITLLISVLKPKNQGDVGEKGNIIWWGIEFEEEEVSSLIRQYEDENPEVKITYVKQSKTDYAQRLINALESGTGPDVFEIHNSWPAMLDPHLARIPDDVISGKDFENTFYPVISQDLKRLDGYVGIPLEYDSLTLFINDEIFALAARNPPSTWMELKDMVNPEIAGSTTILGDDKEILQSGIALGLSENVDYWQDILALMLYQNQASLSKPSSEQAMRAITYYQSFSEIGVWDDSLPRSVLAFSQGKTAMLLAPSRAANDIIMDNPYLRFKTVLLPQLPKNNPSDPDVSYATYWVESVWNRSVNKADSWKFLKFLSEPDSIEEFNANIKANNKIRKISPRKDSAILFNKDPILASAVALAPFAKSWFLNDYTYDGENGINTKIAQAYQKVINLTSGRNLEKVVVEIEGEIGGVLRSYGISGR